MEFLPYLKLIWSVMSLKSKAFFFLVGQQKKQNKKKPSAPNKKCFFIRISIFELKPAESQTSFIHFHIVEIPMI